MAIERSRAIPDPRIAAGVRHYNDQNDTAFIAGVSVPIPVLGLNTGNIAEAERLLEKSQEQRRAVNLRVGLAISQAYQKLPQPTPKSRLSIAMSCLRQRPGRKRRTLDTRKDASTFCK